jgi:hypothetical protein
MSSKVKVRFVMSQKAQELVKTLEQGGVWTSDDLAKELNVQKVKVSRIVRNVRKKFLESKTDAPYIFTTGQGYSIEEKPEYVAFESKMRLQQGYGVLINGVYVFKRCKFLAPKMFTQLSIAYKPKMLTVDKLIRK